MIRWSTQFVSCARRTDGTETCAVVRVCLGQCGCQQRGWVVSFLIAGFAPGFRSAFKAIWMIASVIIVWCGECMHRCVVWWACALLCGCVCIAVWCGGRVHCCVVVCASLCGVVGVCIAVWCGGRVHRCVVWWACASLCGMCVHHCVVWWVHFESRV